MRRTFKYGGPLLATCLALSGLTAAFADTTTTTVTTKTVEMPSFTLPSSTYVVVDPLTGVIKGDYVVGSRVLNGIPLTSNFVVMDKFSRRLVGTFDINGNLVDIATAPAASDVVVTVDSHRAAIEKQIDAMLLANQITAMQADTMRMDIAKLFPATTTTRTVTYNSALTADSGLYSVEARLQPLASKTVVSRIISPRYMTINGQLVLPDELTARRVQMQRRVEDDLLLGRLTRDQAIVLRSDLSDLSNKEARFRVGGLMSDSNAAILASDLNALQLKMDGYEALAPGGVQIGTKILR